MSASDALLGREVFAHSRTRAERDRARRIAVTLEQQLAQVEALVERYSTQHPDRNARTAAHDTLRAIRLVLGTPDEEVAG